MSDTPTSTFVIVGAGLAGVPGASSWTAPRGATGAGPSWR
jgi:NADH dehydrogenase FAD-containing subunit